MRLGNANNLKQKAERTAGPNKLNIVLMTVGELVRQVTIKVNLCDHNTKIFQFAVHRTVREIARYKEPISKVFEIKSRDKIVHASKRHTPKKIMQINYPLWLNNGVKEAIAHTVGLYQVHVTHPSQGSQRAHQQACRRENRVVRRAKRHKDFTVLEWLSTIRNRCMHIRGNNYI